TLISCHGRAPRRGDIRPRRPAGQGSSRSFAIDELGVLENRVHGRPDPVFKPAEEATLATGMTGDSPFLTDSVQDDVAVAVEPDFLDELNVPALLPFAPDPAARARPIDRAPGLHGFLKGLAVRPRAHEPAPG